MVLLGLTLCGSCLCVIKRSRLKDGIFLAISFVVLATMSAIRYDVGFDYSFVYAPAFYRIINDPTGYILAQSRWEPGFRLLVSIMALVSSNFQTFFVVTSILIILLIMLYFWLYSPNPLVSVFLFITLSHYYCSMNFIRQTLAAAIAMFTLPLLKIILDKLREEDVIRALPGALPFIGGYLGLVLLASSFHMSTLLLIPFLVINLIPINKYVLSFYALIATAIYFNTNTIISLITRFWFQYYALDNVHMQVGFAPTFTIAAVVVFLILFVGSNILCEEDEGNRLYVNYAFFAAFFILMGIRHSVLDRMSLLFVLVAPVGISILINGLAEKFRQEWYIWIKRPMITKSIAVFAALIFGVFGGGLVFHHYALTRDHHGVVPYQVIFRQEFYPYYVEYLRNRRRGVVMEQEGYHE